MAQSSTSPEKSRAKKRIENIRGRGRTADLNSSVIWKSVTWQSVTAAVFVAIGLLAPVVSLILIGAFAGILVGLMIYNAVYWRMARKMWDEKSRSEQARIQVERGRKMDDDFARSKIVFRTNLICLGAFALAFVLALLLAQ